MGGLYLDLVRATGFPFPMGGLYLYLVRATLPLPYGWVVFGFGKYPTILCTKLSPSNCLGMPQRRKKEARLKEKKAAFLIPLVQDALSGSMNWADLYNS